MTKEKGVGLPDSQGLLGPGDRYLRASDSLELMRNEWAAGHASQPPTPDLHVLLLEDLLVLLQRQDERLLLKCHSKTAVGSSDSKQTFSPVLKLNAVLIRSVATGTCEEMSQLAWGSGVMITITRLQPALGDVEPIWGLPV